MTGFYVQITIAMVIAFFIFMILSETQTYGQRG